MQDRPDVDEFLRHTPMRAVLGMPDEVLDQAMAVAYQCFRAGRYAEAEVLCRGLLAADHRYWWAYSLYAATLLRLGRARDALVQVTCGLKFEPGQPKLLALQRAAMDAIAGAAKAPAAAPAAVPAPGPAALQQEAA